MRNLSTIANIDPPTTNLIYGEMIDFVADTIDGTPVIKAWVQDLYYALIAILHEASIVPNNIDEGATASQFLDAVKYMTHNIKSLPTYANNAAAIAGGLAVGALYRTGANPDPVCVVH